MSTSAQNSDAEGESHPPWLVTCWRLWALALPSVLGLMRNAGFLFPLVCAAWGAVLTTCCFSSCDSSTLIQGYHSPFVRRLVYMRAGRTGPWKKAECHLGISALLKATYSWILKGGRPSLAWESVPCSYILLAALRLCFSRLLEPIPYQMQARTFPKVGPLTWLCPWVRRSKFRLVQSILSSPPLNA